MTNILMFNTANQHIQELSDGDNETINRLAEAGWRRVEKYELVAIFSPSLNQHKLVLKADVKTWINLGYLAEPTYVYHPDKGTRLVSGDEAQHLLSDGWYDTPAKFPVAGETSVSFASTPKALKDLNKAELISYALNNHGLDLAPDSLTKAQIIEAIEAAEKGE